MQSPVIKNLRMRARIIRRLLLSCCGVCAVFVIFFLHGYKDGTHKEMPAFIDPKEFLLTRSASAEGRREREKCRAGVPCVYSDPVDFRIVVLTYSRPRSLLILLESLNDLELDGHKGALEIWVDRNQQDMVHQELLETAYNFTWRQGRSTVHIQTRHAGIYGQWIDTWRPRDSGRGGEKELALFLEDDMTVSRFAYRWIRAGHAMYGNRSDFAGISLNGGAQMSAHNSGKRIINGDVAFMYVCIGTWGFSPSPHVWAEFQDWYHANTSSVAVDGSENWKLSSRKTFHPYVPDSLPSEWYMSFEKTGREDTMWEMWFIFYANEKSLFTVYSNILNRSVSVEACTWKNWILCVLDAEELDDRLCLAYNRQEVGLHWMEGDPKTQSCPFVREWLPSYIDFPKEPAKYDWWGNMMTG